MRGCLALTLTRTTPPNPTPNPTPPNPSPHPKPKPSPNPNQAMDIAADMCVYTNKNYVTELLSTSPEKKPEAEE